MRSSREVAPRRARAKGFEGGLDFVVVGAAVEDLDVDVGFGAAGEAFEEVGDELGLEVADDGDVDLVVDGVGGAAGEVDGGDGEGLVHGHDEVAGAEDAALVAEGF